MIRTCLSLFARRAVVGASLFLAASGFAQTRHSTQVSDLGIKVPAITKTSALLGPTDAGRKLHLSVSLPLGDAEGLQKFVDSVSNPNSPSYRQFITPEEVGQRFGVSQSAVANLVDYLKSCGMNVTLIAKNRMSVLADCTVGQAENAFGSQINNYANGTNKNYPSSFFSFSSTLRAPSDVAPFISSISGIESFTKPKPRTLTTNQARSLYSMTNSYTGGGKGAGRSIGISNWDGFDLGNVPIFATAMSLPNPAGGVGSNIHVVTVNGGTSGDFPQGEGDLDIQMVLGMAPLADIYVYDGGGGDLIGVLTQEVNDNTADVISESYGWNLDPVMAMSAHNLHLSMGAQGITYMAASGDSGTDLEPFSYPNYDPEVLMVGGTVATVNAQGNRVTEVGWQFGGGGWSENPIAFNKLPAYQKGKGVPTKINFRLCPDVALHASGDTDGAFQFYYFGQLELNASGTSFASPVFAGSLAIAEQQLIALGRLSPNPDGKRRFGRIQDLFYAQNGRPDVWFDVTLGNNGSLPDGSDSNATDGWDFVTGWGAMNFDGFVNSQIGASVLQAVTISPTTLTGGNNATGTIVLSSQPTAPVKVTLSSNNPSLIVPASVTVPVGSNLGTFSITTKSVMTQTVGTVTATASSITRTGDVTLIPAVLTALSLNPTSVAGGQNSAGTLTLSGPAPPGGVPISVQSSDPIVTVPMMVMVQAGKSSVTFPISTTPVVSNWSATITAVLGDVTLTQDIGVTAPVVSSLKLAPNSVAGGTSSVGTVTITSAAPSGGTSITLTSDQATAQMPNFVTIPEGMTSVTFTITTVAVSADQALTIGATLNNQTVNAPFTIKAPVLTTFSLSASTITGGNNVSATLTLSNPAPTGGMSVALASDKSAVVVPNSISIQAGQSSVSFVVTTNAVAANITANVTATLGSVVKTAPLAVTIAKISTVTASPSPVQGGTSATIMVTLTGTAPVSGTVVTLTCDKGAVPVPATFTVPAGQSTLSVLTSTIAVNADVIATITANANGTSATTTLKVLAPKITGISLLPGTLTGGASSAATVTLTGVAPAGGLTITMASDKAAASLPATLTIPTGQSVGTVSIATTAGTASVTANISATLAGSTTATPLTIMVAKLQSVILTPSPVTGGQVCNGKITLSGAAPAGGWTVSLASSGKAASVPASVSIPAGASSAIFAVTSSPVATNASVSLTSSVNGVTITSPLTVMAPVPISMSLAGANAPGGTPVTGSVTISGNAPTGGLVVTFDSNATAAKVPAKITIPAGQSTGTFTVTTTSVPSDVYTTIRASANLIVVYAYVTIQAPRVASITMNPTSVAGGKTATSTLKPTATAPAGGLMVTLSSLNSAVSVPASVKVSGTSATFTATTFGVSADTNATISAYLNGTNSTGTLAVTAPNVTAIKLDKATLKGGSQLTGSVTIASAAGPSGVIVTISSTDPSVDGTTVTVPSGKTVGAFSLSTHPVGDDVSPSVVATRGASSVKATVKITAPVAKMTLNPTSVKGGNSSTATITLDGPAPSGYTWSITAPAPASAPASVTFSAGSSSATFTVNTVSGSAIKTAAIAAKRKTVSLTATLTIVK